MASDRTLILESARAVLDTHLDRPLGRRVNWSSDDPSDMTLDVAMPYPGAFMEAELRSAIVTSLAAHFPDKAPGVCFLKAITSHAVQQGLRPLEGVKNIVAVASGKGGVGKSTTAANLALALAADGASVGLLDADIYGPSQPLILGIEGRPEIIDGTMMEPMRRHGLQANSIGFLVDRSQPMVWRGPMVTQALQQLLMQTRWDQLDYLIVDMPPGTGDIQLTLSQKVPVTGAVIVTTPQEVALMDAEKGLRMFQKVGIPILGVIENMSLHVCSQCQHVEHIFGQGGAQRMCDTSAVAFLGSLPLDIHIREDADAGVPTVARSPESVISQSYLMIGRAMARAIALKADDMTSKFPKIVVRPT